VILFCLFGRAHLADHKIAGTQAKAANLALADVDVFVAGKQVFAAQEADTVLYDLERAAAEYVALAFGAGAQQAHDQVVLLEAGVAGNAHRPGHFAQIVQVHGI